MAPRACTSLACCLLLTLGGGALADWRSSALLNSSDADDHVALIQHGAQPHRRKSKAAAARVGGKFREGIGRVRRQDPGELDSAYDILYREQYCAAYPEFCQAPFDCMNASPETETKVLLEGWAPDGKPNYASWCSDPQYYSYATRCAAGKLVEAGRIQYLLTEAGMFDGLCNEADGSYCFMDGHCVDETVNENTTVDEMVQLCDKRFGREAWAHFGSNTSAPEDTIGYAIEFLIDPRDGFNTPAQTRPYLLAACAMGNYHCDVVYCKETYCKNEYYIKKYSHLLKEYGWVK